MWFNHFSVLISGLAEAWFSSLVSTKSPLHSVGTMWLRKGSLGASGSGLGDKEHTKEPGQTDPAPFSPLISPGSFTMDGANSSTHVDNALHL